VASDKETFEKWKDRESLIILYLGGGEIFQNFLLYLLVLEKIKNAEPAGIGSFLVAMLYSDILRGLADTSCPSVKEPLFLSLRFYEFYFTRFFL